VIILSKKSKVTQEQKEEIYKSLLKDFDLGDFEGIKVVSENKEKLKEKLIYIGENNIL
jgi:inorganic pyrophosphatase/exopolyphosphatase